MFIKVTLHGTAIPLPLRASEVVLVTPRFAIDADGEVPDGSNVDLTNGKMLSVNESPDNILDQCEQAAASAPALSGFDRLITLLEGMQAYRQSPVIPAS